MAKRKKESVDKDRTRGAEAFRQMTPKKKIEHIWYYYKWFILGAAALIAIAISLTVDIVNRDNGILNIALIGDYDTGMTDFVQEDMQQFIDFQERQIVTVDTSLYLDEEKYGAQLITTSITKLGTYLIAGDYDVIIDDGIVVENYSHQDALLDLRTVLSKDLQKKYEDRFVYYENGMEEKIVTGIDISDLPWTKRCAILLDTPIVSITTTANNSENAKILLERILTYEE
ncbi:MAG: hypothetical protein ACI4CT_02670 [Lachnospiraceae bacterium]